MKRRMTTQIESFGSSFSEEDGHSSDMDLQVAQVAGVSLEGTIQDEPEEK